METPQQKRERGGSNKAEQTRRRADGPAKQVLPAKQLPIYLNWWKLRLNSI